MVLDHFGLREAPFRITPHTDFFFHGAGRGATLDALLYAIVNDEGIVKVSGEVGSGKTMLCRVLIERLPPTVRSVYLAAPSFAPDELLRELAHELEARPADNRLASMLRALQERLIELYAADRRAVILIDEAHAMPDETLEQVRLLANLEAGRRKLLQIVLFGQPELDARLAGPRLRPLKDRITHGFRMRPLSRAEVGAYISFRMRAAGYRGAGAFTPRAIEAIARASGGLTRRVNVLADKCLLAAYAADRREVGAREARRAIADTEFASPAPRRTASLLPAAALLALGVLLGAAGFWALSPGTVDSAAAPAASAPPVPHGAERQPRPVSVSRLTAEQASRMRDYQVGDAQPLLRARIAATLARLEREPDERYSIELFFTTRSDPARIERFVARNADWMTTENTLVIPVLERSAHGARYRVRVSVGVYPSREEAQRAERDLPPRYRRAAGPLVRSFSELRRRI
jgi:type II secretory pathway predicted ATPase ExeA